MPQTDFLQRPRQLEIDVTLGGPGIDPHLSKKAVLDTGSTDSSIPDEIYDELQQLGELSIIGDTELLLHGQSRGQGRRVLLIECRVAFQGVGPKSIRAAVHPGDFLLGMDWFNQVDTRYLTVGGLWRLNITEP